MPKDNWRTVCYKDKKHVLWGAGAQTKKPKPTTNAAQRLVFPFSPSVNGIPKIVREKSRH